MCKWEVSGCKNSHSDFTYFYVITYTHHPPSPFSSPENIVTTKSDVNKLVLLKPLDWFSVCINSVHSPPSSGILHRNFLRLTPPPHLALISSPRGFLKCSELTLRFCLFHKFFNYRKGCGAAESTCLVFVCFVVINPRVLSANKVDLGLFLSHKILLPPPPQHIFTPLHLAADNGNRKMVELLVQHGANINQQNIGLSDI